MELAGFIGAAFAKGDLFIFDGRVPPPPAAPREAGLSHHTVAVGDVIETEAGQGAHVAYDGDIFVELVLLLDLIEADLKGGSFVFFNLDGGVAVVAVEVEGAVQQVGGDDEGAAEAAVFVGGECGRADVLPVGILEADGLSAVGDQGLPLVVVVHHDALEIHGLSWPIDGTVGEKGGLIGRFLAA